LVLEDNEPVKEIARSTSREATFSDRSNKRNMYLVAPSTSIKESAYFPLF